MENVIVLKDNKFIIIDSEIAKNNKLQVAYSNPGRNSSASIYLENGLHISIDKSTYMEGDRSYLFVYAGNYVVEAQFENYILDICYLANKYNTISMIDIIKQIVEKENRNADTRAERKLNNSKKEIITLSEQIKEFKEITINEFRKTNSKICKRK
jgi:hypothetical protein